MTDAHPPRLLRSGLTGRVYVVTRRRHARETAEVAEWAARGLTHPSLLADPKAVLGLDDMDIPDDEDDVAILLGQARTRLERSAS